MTCRMSALFIASQATYIANASYKLVLPIKYISSFNHCSLSGAMYRIIYPPHHRITECEWNDHDNCVLNHCRFFFVRAGMMAWLFINLSLFAKSYLAGSVNLSVILYQFFCAVLDRTIFLIDHLLTNYLCN